MCEQPQDEPNQEVVHMSDNLASELLYLVIAITQHVRVPIKEHQTTMLAQMTDVINQLQTDEVIPHEDFAPHISNINIGQELSISFSDPLVEEL